MVRWRAALAFFVLWGAGFEAAHAAEKKPGDGPRIIAVTPLEITRGTKTTLLLRGLKLDTATGVQVSPDTAQLAATIGEKKKAPLPNGAEANKIGDTQVAAIIDTPESLAATSLKIAVTTPEGTTAALEIPVVNATDLTDEKEPNGGFREAQPIKAGERLRGCIKEDKDVDVFRFEEACRYESNDRSARGAPELFARSRADALRSDRKLLS